MEGVWGTRRDGCGLKTVRMRQRRCIERIVVKLAMRCMHQYDTHTQERFKRCLEMCRAAHVMRMIDVLLCVWSHNDALLQGTHVQSASMCLCVLERHITNDHFWTHSTASALTPLPLNDHHNRDDVEATFSRVQRDTWHDDTALQRYTPPTGACQQANTIKTLEACKQKATLQLLDKRMTTYLIN